MKRISNNKTNLIPFYIRNGVDVTDASDIKFVQLGSDKEQTLPISQSSVDCHVAIFEVSVPADHFQNGSYRIEVLNSTGDTLLSASGLVDGFLDTDPRAFIVKMS